MQKTQESRVRSPGGGRSWRRKRQLTPVLMVVWKSHGQRWRATVHRVSEEVGYDWTGLKQVYSTMTVRNLCSPDSTHVRERQTIAVIHLVIMLKGRHTLVGLEAGAGGFCKGCTQGRLTFLVRGAGKSSLRGGVRERPRRVRKPMWVSIPGRR